MGRAGSYGAVFSVKMETICRLKAVSRGREFAPVILAGGSGTRFWPRSRQARAKQVLALDGERTMIQQTLDRLLPLADAGDVWVITNDLLDETDCGAACRRCRGSRF